MDEQRERADAAETHELPKGNEVQRDRRVKRRLEVSKSDACGGQRAVRPAEQLGHEHVVWMGVTPTMRRRLHSLEESPP